MSLTRPIPLPTGTVADIKNVRRVMTPRHREVQPDLNYPDMDTISGPDSKS